MKAKLPTFLLVIFIAAWMRLDGLGLWSHFRYDEGTLASLVLDMLHGKRWPLTGIPSSAGVPNSPMTVYVLGPLFALSDHPWVWHAGVALWNVFGVAVFVALVCRLSGFRVALIAGLAYAIHPYAVHYSTFLWAQNTHTPLILLGLWLGWLGLVEGRRWAQTWCWPVFVAGLQIHFAAWTLAPLMLYLTWQGRKRLAWSALAWAALLTAIPLVLFMLGLSQQSSGAANRLQTIVEIVRHDLRFRTDPLLFLVQLASGLGLEGRAQNGTEAVLEALWRWDTLWLGAGLGLGGLGMLSAWWQTERKVTTLLWLWILLTPLLFIPKWTGTGVRIFYMIPTIPPLMWALGLGATTLSRVGRLRPPVTWAVVMILALVWSNQLVWTTNFKRWLDEHYTHNNEEDRQTFISLRRILPVRAALSSYEDVLIVGGSPHETNTYVWSPLLYNTARCVRDVVMDNSQIIVRPSGSFAVLYPPDNRPHPRKDFYQNESEQRFAMRPGEDDYVLYVHQRSPAWDAFEVVALQNTPIFTRGVQVTGYSLDQNSRTLGTRWRVHRAHDRDFSYFVHFLDHQGERLAGYDRSFYPVSFQCQGDELIIWLEEVSWPDETEALRIGVYTYQDGRALDSESLVVSLKPDLSE